MENEEDLALDLVEEIIQQPPVYEGFEINTVKISNDHPGMIIVSSNLRFFSEYFLHNSRFKS